MDNDPLSDPNCNIYRPTFDLVNLPISEVLALNVALEVQRKKDEAEEATPHAEGLIETLERDLTNLTKVDLPKAREIFNALVASENSRNRWLAAACIDRFLQAEAAAGDNEMMELAIYGCIDLLFDQDDDVWDLANTVVNKAIQERRIDPQMGGWLLEEVVEAHHTREQS